MVQPLAVAFTAFADVWPRDTETEIGAALCVIGAGRILTLTTCVCQMFFYVSFSEPYSQVPSKRGVPINRSQKNSEIQ